ncbi:MAG TPA: S41 family peptidase [Lachnospiraceae bacterium]|nr:S41 family peptidase [Lachnospiraceae bacterium]
MRKKTVKCGAAALIAIMGIASLSGCGNKEKVSDTKSTTESSGSTVSDGGFDPTSDEVKDKTKEIENYIKYYYYFDEDPEKQAESYYDGIMEGLDDPYSVYYTKEEYQQLMEDDSGQYVGIGATVSKNVDTNEIYIVKPLADTPAEKAGLLPGDVVIKIDDTEITADMELEAVVKMIRGEEGTDVNVTVKREGSTDPVVIKITRALVENKTVSYEMLQGNIGYIQVDQFIDNTPDQFIEGIDKLTAEGATSFVFDLRNNPGGLLTAVIKMCDYIVDDNATVPGAEKAGDLLYTIDKNGKTIERYSCSDNHSVDIPIVVLVNGNSASASEVFTSCMRDYGKAKIVGTTTFGKGIVQSVLPLKDGSAIKVTIAKYYTPSMTEIHKIGIEPDVVIDLPDELKKTIRIPHKDDTQLQEAVKQLGGAPLTDD